MTVLNSQLQPGSETFESNRAAMQAVVDDLHATLARTALGGSEAARAKHTARGKLLVRDRIDALLDPGSAFWRSRRWPRTACMKTPCRPPAWWLVSAA